MMHLNPPSAYTGSPEQRGHRLSFTNLYHVACLVVSMIGFGVMMNGVVEEALINNQYIPPVHAKELNDERHTKEKAVGGMLAMMGGFYLSAAKKLTE